MEAGQPPAATPAAAIKISDDLASRRKYARYLERVIECEDAFMSGVSAFETNRAG